MPKDVMALLVQAQGPIKQKIDMRMEPLGYAMLKVFMTMNANQWQMWVQSVGNNVAC